MENIQTAAAIICICLMICVALYWDTNRRKNTANAAQNDAERWRYYAPQVAQMLGMPFEDMVKDVDEARRDGWEISTKPIDEDEGWHIDREVIWNGAKTQQIICQMEHADEIVVDKELTHRVFLRLNPSAAEKERQRLLHERDTLGTAIRDAAVKRGICRDDSDLAGPELLLLCHDLARA